MRFSTRNAYYLRASNYRVVPTFLYLDERHVLWMSERVLNLVIGAMQSKMEHLLTVEKDLKKHKVHVERGEGYQYCYFLRKTTRTEVVLLKKKTFSLRPPSPPPAPEAEPSRKRKAASEAPRRSRRARDRSESLNERIGEEDDIIAQDDDDDFIQIKEEPVDFDEVGENDEYAPSPEGLEDERDIKDWKPDVDLSYQGFGTTSVQLVLIIEPYPPLPPSQYAPPSSRLSSRSVSIALSRSRSRTQGGKAGTGRYSSTSLALDNPMRAPLPHVRNMRNATRSVSIAATPAPGASRASPYFGRESVTPGPGASSRRTPLFMPRDTPFGDDEEDEDEQEAYAEALLQGRLRLPSVAPRDDDEDDNPLDEPEGMMAIGERLVRASEIEEGVVRTHGGWEERAEGEESDVFGREEIGD